MLISTADYQPFYGKPYFSNVIFAGSVGLSLFIGVGLAFTKLLQNKIKKCLYFNTSVSEMSQIWQTTWKLLKTSQ